MHIFKQTILERDFYFVCIDLVVYYVHVPKGANITIFEDLRVEGDVRCRLLKYHKYLVRDKRISMIDDTRMIVIRFHQGRIAYKYWYKSPDEPKLRWYAKYAMLDIYEREYRDFDILFYPATFKAKVNGHRLLFVYDREIIVFIDRTHKQIIHGNADDMFNLYLDMFRGNIQMDGRYIKCHGSRKIKLTKK